MRWCSWLGADLSAAIIALGFFGLPGVLPAQDTKDFAEVRGAKDLAPDSRQWEDILPVAQNLKLDGDAATAAKKPILIFFNLTACPYCRAALREAIVPMFRNAGWRSAIEFRQVTVDDGKSLVDFDGKTVANRLFAQQRKATFTPTVMVVDGKGQLLGDAIIGIANFDFYGSYVDALAKKGIEEMRAQP